MSSLRIGHLARLGGVSVRMLRHYHEIGLLVPEQVDPSTGYREYAAGQLDVLRRIVALKALGLPLAEITDIVHARRTDAELRALLVARRAEIVAGIDDAHRAVARIDEFVRHLDHPKEPTMSTSSLQVELKSVPSRLVAQVSAVAESWAPADIGPVIQPLYPELMAALERAGVAMTGPSTAWYDDTPDGRVRVHATIEIGERPATDPTTAGFEVVELPVLDLVAAAIHRGTMDDCDTTYQALLAWIDEHGYRALGYSREQDIDCGPDRAWIVELQLPVERVAATA